MGPIIYKTSERKKVKKMIFKPIQLIFKINFVSYQKTYKSVFFLSTKLRILMTTACMYIYYVLCIYIMYVYILTMLIVYVFTNNLIIIYF